MPAEVVVADDVAIARLIPTLLRVERRAEAGTAQHLVTARILDHLRADVAREHRDRIIQHPVGRAAVGGAARDALVAVVGIHVNGKEKLAYVADAFGPLGALLGARQRRQQQGRQDGYDRDNDQQLDQGESKLPSRLAGSRIRELFLIRDGLRRFDGDEGPT